MVTKSANKRINAQRTRTKYGLPRDATSEQIRAAAKAAVEARGEVWVEKPAQVEWRNGRKPVTAAPEQKPTQPEKQPTAKVLHEPQRWDATRTIKQTRGHWSICIGHVLGNRERTDLEALYAKPDAANRPANPRQPNARSLGAALAANTDLRDLYSPESEDDNERVMAATLPNGIQNFAHQVRVIAKEKFDPTDIGTQK